jgi:DNA-directed RNA polymerase subunit beta'
MKFSETTSIGQMLFENALPEDMRAEWRNVSMDKKSMKTMLAQLAERHPDKYKDVVQGLMNVGLKAARSTGTTITLSALKQPPEVKALIEATRREAEAILDDERLPEDERTNRVAKLMLDRGDQIKKKVYELGLKNRNPYALQILSGARGNANQLQQLVAGDGLVVDHLNRLIPVPLLTGYAQGLLPHEYWASTYGARKGTVSTKFATADAGFLTKQLLQSLHRQVITELDCGTADGVAYPADDPSNIGAVLASDMGGMKAGSIIRPSNFKTLKSSGVKTVILRSPLTCRAPDGLCAKCAGARNGQGDLPSIGDNVGIVSGHTIGERISQGSLDVKHTGGQASQAITNERSGFQYLNKLMQVPDRFPQTGVQVEHDGVVKSIEPAPQGGSYVVTNTDKVHVPMDRTITVKPGDTLEAGDMVTDGIPHPEMLARTKGLSVARNRMVELLSEGLKNTGASAQRRHLETLARSLVNHVRITGDEPVAGFLPEDVVSYDVLRTRWQPREGAKKRSLALARGMWLEEPTGGHTVGTRVGREVYDDLKLKGVGEVLTYDKAPPFEATHLRLMEHASHDDNWLTRFVGSYNKKSMLDALYRGSTAPLEDTSFVPGLVKAKDFGSALETEGKY